MSRLTIDDYIQRVEHLPPAPRVLPQLLVLLSQPNANCDRLVELISLDVALTTGVLRLCNSAYLGNSMPCADLQEAVTRLGFSQVYRLVAAIGGAAVLAPPQPGYGIQIGELWRHSVTAAIAAEIVARRIQENDTLAFTATLLHDIGKVILSNALHPLYAKLLVEIDKSPCAMIEAEEHFLGVQHADTGARLLDLWKFPSSLITAVRFHHRPDRAGKYDRLAALVYIGNWIAYQIGHGYGFSAFAMRHRAEVLDLLGLTSDDLPRMILATFDCRETIETLFNTSGA